MAIPVMTNTMDAPFRKLTANTELQAGLAACADIRHHRLPLPSAEADDARLVAVVRLSKRPGCHLSLWDAATFSFVNCSGFLMRQSSDGAPRAITRPTI